MSKYGIVKHEYINKNTSKTDIAISQHYIYYYRRLFKRWINDRTKMEVLGCADDIWYYLTSRESRSSDSVLFFSDKEMAEYFTAYLNSVEYDLFTLHEVD